MDNIVELRNFLIEQTNKCATKEISPEEADATANLSGKIMSSLKLELMYAKANSRKPSIAFMDSETNSASQT